MAVKNPSQWIPGTGRGYVVVPGLQKFQDNLGKLLITNSGNNIITTPAYTIGKYATLWTASGV